MLTHVIPVVLLASTASAITCLNIGQTATATWTNSRKQTCTWTGTVGVNFGISPKNGKPYGCNGRCGDDCNGGTFNGALGNAYTQNCWTHDICSYFEGATGGLTDANCGKAFQNASPDYVGGILAGCGRTNPNNPAQAPSQQPVCTGGQSSSSNSDGNLVASNPGDTNDGSGDPSDTNDGSGDPSDTSNGSGDPSDTNTGSGDPSDPNDGSASSGDTNDGSGDPSDTNTGSGDPSDPNDGSASSGDTNDGSGDPSDTNDGSESPEDTNDGSANDSGSGDSGDGDGDQSGIGRRGRYARRSYA